MSRHLPVLLLLGVGCSEPPPTGLSWVWPADGQTVVPRDATLEVELGDLQLPDDYPLPDGFVRLVQLDTEEDGFVDGYLERVETRVRFVPAAPLAADATYGWSVGDVPELARAPEFDLRKAVFGEATFSTEAVGTVLDVVLAPDTGEVCAVTSVPIRRLAENPPIVFTLDGVVLSGPMRVVSEAAFLDLPLQGQALGVVCVWGGVLEAGGTVRALFADRGPWQFTLEEVPVAEVLAERHRVSGPGALR